MKKLSWPKSKFNRELFASAIVFASLAAILLLLPPGAREFAMLVCAWVGLLYVIVPWWSKRLQWFLYGKPENQEQKTKEEKDGH